jgi:hypothetical protein
MKTNAKQKKILPEVHIMGDLQDVKNLFAGVNKKRTIVIFRDAEQGGFYAEVDEEIQPILSVDITKLEKDYKMIYFQFFPSSKKIEPLTQEQNDLKEPESKEIKDQGEKKKKGKKGKKQQKRKKK